MTPRELIDGAELALRHIDAAGGPPPAHRRRVAWARGVIQQAKAGDGGLGALWFLPMLRLAVLAITGAAAVMGIGLVAKTAREAGKAVPEVVPKLTTIFLVGVSAWVGLSLLERFSGRRRKAA